jgi:hypothetical protein
MKHLHRIVLSSTVRLCRTALLLCLAGMPVHWLAAFELPSQAPSGAIILTIDGKIGIKNTSEAAVFDAALIDALPQKSFVTTTPWFKAPTKFTGPLLRDVLQALKAQGTNLKATALNDYKINIPMQDILKYDVILARQIDGKTISVRDKGPLFVIYPFDSAAELKSLTYYSRSIWQLKALSVE